LSESQIDALYRYAKAQYDIGNYSVAADCLFQYIPLSSSSPTRLKEFHSALWGKFAAEILMQNWDVAVEDLTRLRELASGKSYGTSLEQLQQRTWILHWSLFVHFNHPSGRNGIIEMFMQDKYVTSLIVSRITLARLSSLSSLCLCLCL
jgi:translation initiation factor 3 subunit E